MQKPVVFKSDRNELFGVLHLPYRIGVDRHVPAVVFCHGFTGTKVEAHRIFVKMARVLERHGIASLRFDFRGCGDSGGDFLNTTVMGEIEDACNAVNFICTQSRIDKDRIGLLGLSLGGAVSAYVAGKDPRITALALWAPAADLEEEEEQMQKDHETKKIRRLKAMDYYGTLIGREFMEEIPKIKPLTAIKGFNGSTIILHGTKDDSVPLSHSLKFYNILKKKGLKVERYLIKDSNHVFSSYVWEQEVINKTLRFFVKNL